MTTERKRLLFDIETSLYRGVFWKPGKIYLTQENITEDATIICICWKWADKKTVYSLTWDKKHNDKKMIQEFASILDSADEAVAHYGDGFDIKWVRTQCLKHGVSLSPRITSIDTWKVAKYGFMFPSNKLNDIAQKLGLGSKKPMAFNDWKLVMDDAPGALDKMVRYCKHDVRLLDAVTKRFIPYMVARTHIGEFMRDCPECGSRRTVINQNKVIASRSGYRSITLRCRDCGKYNTVAVSRLDKPV